MTTTLNPRENSERRSLEKKKQGEIVFNISGTRYDVVKEVGRDIFKWTLSTDPKKEWDIAWIDYITDSTIFQNLKPFQRISFFPGIKCIARKDQLGKNLMQLKRKFPDEYDFFPETYILPTDYHEFKAHLSRDKNQVFIVKPQASCQGKGIFLTQSISDIDRSADYVAQKYLAEPYLIDGLKFDMRIYVFLLSCDPLKIYIYEDGLVRLATEPYRYPQSENLSDICMHLTNYAINKNNPNFVFNESASDDNVGHKRSIKALFKMFEQEGHDVKRLWNEIKEIIIKTLCSVQPLLAQSYKSYHYKSFPASNCFQLLGFDVMLDQYLKPWLIEVNQSPSWTTDTPLDQTIKENAIKDALTILNVTAKDRFNYRKKSREEIEARSLLGRPRKQTEEQIRAEILEASRKLEQWEQTVETGGYERIFPANDSEDYNVYIEAAKEGLSVKETSPWKSYSTTIELANEKLNREVSLKIEKSPSNAKPFSAKPKNKEIPLKEKKPRIYKSPQKIDRDTLVCSDPRNLGDDIQVVNLNEEIKTTNDTSQNLECYIPKKKSTSNHQKSDFMKKLQRIEKTLIKIEDLNDLFETNTSSTANFFNKTSRKNADVINTTILEHQAHLNMSTIQKQFASSILERLASRKKPSAKTLVHVPLENPGAVRLDLSNTNKMTIDKSLQGNNSGYLSKRLAQQSMSPDIKKTLVNKEDEQSREGLGLNRSLKFRNSMQMSQSQSYGNIIFGREMTRRSSQSYFNNRDAFKRIENSYSDLSKAKASFNTSYEKSYGVKRNSYESGNASQPIKASSTSYLFLKRK